MSEEATSLPSVGSNSFGFSMPDGFSAGASSPSLAGLTGVGSGMTLPTQQVGANSFGFTMADTGNMAAKLGNGLGAASKALSVPAPTAMPGISGGGVGMRLPEQSFAAPVVDFVAAPGSVGGNGLLQMLQKYRPGISQ
ncbi:hypothetical protein [Burkholderia stagnalis]|uniref:hypothetical protein n=1 Tax=Burkholderia stagnalis TaxID=1503054 RepID=UPI0007593A4F|nr:hypothetical protein [Burkholderia stagnalis]KVL90762.1 hypothetical protein WT02_23120 [Burkholderia stagnalis]KVL93738.1 hypothetical protein WT03_14935 [Burkholderia stagnalis]KVM02161.1 hypothetical protein WT04_30695 [Burkholderia stagnalis]